MVRSIADVCELEVVTEVLDSAPGVRPAAPGHAAVRRARGRAAVEPARRDDRRALGRRHRRDRRACRHPGGRHRPRSPRPRRRRPSSRTPTTRRPTTCPSPTPRPTTRTTRRKRTAKRRSGRTSASTRSGSPPTRGDVRHAALLPRRQAGVPRLRRPDRGVHERARARPVDRDRRRRGARPGGRLDLAGGRRAGGVSELTVTVEDMNTYVLTGLADDLAEGTTDGRPRAAGAGHGAAAGRRRLGGRRRAARGARRSRSRSGWLVSFIVKPDPTRLAPSPPFDAEARRAAASWWTALEDAAATGTERSCGTAAIRPALSAA